MFFPIVDDLLFFLFLVHVGFDLKCFETFFGLIFLARKKGLSSECSSIYNDKLFFLLLASNVGFNSNCIEHLFLGDHHKTEK